MKRWGIFGAIIGIVIGGFVLSSVVSAQEQRDPTRRLQISPLHTFISIAPGSSYAGSVRLENTGTETLLVTLDAEAFNIKNEQYDYTFLPDSPINDWVRFVTPEVTLKPDQVYEAKFLISVPIEAEPGGAYISMFAASLPSEGTSIQSVDRVGSLFYINLAGDTTKKGELISFSAPWIQASNTIPWSATVRNGGTTHFQTDYAVSLQTLWGSTISETSNSALILPRTVRLISDSLEHPQWIGIYKVSHSFTLGDNETTQDSQLIVYAPLTQLIPLIIVIGGLIMIVVQSARRHTRNKV